MKGVDYISPGYENNWQNPQPTSNITYKLISNPQPTSNNHIIKPTVTKRKMKPQRARALDKDECKIWTQVKFNA